LNEAKERAEIAESQVNKLKMKAKEFGKKVRQVFSSAVTFKALGISGSCHHMENCFFRGF